MEDQKKRILKVSFGFLLVETFLVISEELFRNHTENLYSQEIKLLLLSSM